ncbi:hypothetical protein Tco_0616190 [Tanacetum coccineum]
MASAIIYLATNQKFNFSKYIFESMVKNVDSSVKFLMYLRFVQVFVNQQAGDMSNHKRIYVTPSHTKKVFGNIKRERKGFSRRVTPLFPTMMVQAQEEIGEGSTNPTDPHHTPIITQPSTSKPQKKQKPRKPKRKDTKIPQSSGPTEPIADEVANEENIPTYSNDPLLSGEDSLKLSDLMEICTKLQQRVLNLENTKTAQAQEISSLKMRVKRLEKKKGSRTHKLKRLFKVGRSAQVVFFEDEGLGDQEDASKQGRKIDDIDQDAKQSVKVVEEVVSTAEVSAAAIITTEEITLAQSLAELRNVKPKIVVQDPVHSTTITTPSTIPRAKGIVFHKQEQAPTPIVSLQQPTQIKDKAEEEEQARLAREKAEKVEEANKFMDKFASNMTECERVLAERMYIAIDTIPLATKPPSIVDWKIVKEGKISLFQIIRANGSSKRYSSMIQMLRDFDREDLETLWKLVKDNHGSTRPEEGYKRVL